MMISLRMFPGFQLLQSNLGIQEAADVVNIMYNMMQQQNSQLLTERIFILE